MTRYAKDTSVSIESSKAEIERTLRRYGAEQFMSGWDQGKAMIGFVVHGRHVRFVLPLPDRKEYRTTETGRSRATAAIEKAWEQGQRASWRSLALVIKAKLESVETGIFTFEQEFFPHFVLPSGQTVGEVMIPQLESITAGKAVALLPGAKGGRGQ